MSIDIYLVDIRNAPGNMKKQRVEWRAGMTAFSAVSDALGMNIAKKIQIDLSENVKGLTVAWSDKDSEEHSGIGGVDSLNWEIGQASVLTITYQSCDTSEELIRKSTEWLLGTES